MSNVDKKVARSGGRMQTGWMFVVRAVERLNGARYLVAIHHAVWLASNGRLIDVTPFHPDERHRPYAPGGNVLFLLDDSAAPVDIGNVRGPLPSRFAPLDYASAEMTIHLQKLAADEQIRWREAFDAAMPKARH